MKKSKEKQISKDAIKISGKMTDLLLGLYEKYPPEDNKEFVSISSQMMSALCDVRRRLMDAVTTVTKDAHITRSMMKVAQDGIDKAYDKDDETVARLN